MEYISTRGSAPRMDFAGATLAGLCSDGGLYLPDTFPALDPERIRGMRGLDYPALAAAVLGHFTGEAMARDDLERLVHRAYGDFSHDAVAPLRQLDDDLFFMELFHGPTLAFKDYALQLLGQLFQHLLSQSGEHRTIVGATSGDTGSAAIAAVRGLDSVKLYMLHPLDRVSEVQRRQMTTVLDDNVHNLAVRGAFDDCQNLVKSLFNDAEFRAGHRLSAVNSINWARIAAQVVYYFRAALALGAPDRAVNFAVPTGNFGNVLAGYVAGRMGLPINRLIIGSNRNDILTRFFENGVMEQRAVSPTLSPSMDIQISSNFERYLYLLLDRDSERLCAYMKEFSESGRFSVDKTLLEKARSEFAAWRLDDEQAAREMRAVYETTGEIIEPHSIIGVAAARREKAAAGESKAAGDPAAPTVVLGTAHPAKFPDAVQQAIGRAAPLPERLHGLMNLPERCDVIDNDLDQLKRAIESGA